MYKSLALALAATAAAIPTPQSTGTGGISLHMRVDGTYVPINLVNNGTAGNFVLSANPGSGVGTPAYVTAKNADGYSALIFTLPDSTGADTAFGAGAPDIGHREDVAEPVYATINFEQYEWQLARDGSVTHKLGSALNQFLACEDALVDGSKNTYLKWGEEGATGGLPEGCSSTSLQLNVPGPYAGN